MKTLLTCCLFSLILSGYASAQAEAPNNESLVWQKWSTSVFEQAQAQHRFVLLDLEAVWCHWCHVMDEKTYKDPKVISLLNSHYLLVKVDQDSQPDLSNRYEDYGWPATVVFNSEGHEIVKRRGYLAPDEMAPMLQAIIDDPTPGPSVRPEVKPLPVSEPVLSKAMQKDLQSRYVAGYDRVQGSWGRYQKFLDWDSVEYSMLLAREDQNVAASWRARYTLVQQLHLLDPAWGGVYQYSAGSDWDSPHFEKIMQMQAENLRIYSMGYSQWHDRRFLHAAREIRRYLLTFLRSPEGAFYTSQDADLVDGVHSASYFALDDAGRRRLGVPRVDKHIYSRENGWAISALAALYSATSDSAVLGDAVEAAEWIVKNRSLPGGGFRHGDQDAGGPYLGDSIAMCRAFLSLYVVTADREWLDRAQSAMDFIASTFRDSQGIGFITAKASEGDRYQPHQQREENVMVARVANLLFNEAGESRYRQVAKDALSYLVTQPSIDSVPASSILLADRELQRPPLRLLVVGEKNDPAAAALFRTAIQYAPFYKVVEWRGPQDVLPAELSQSIKEPPEQKEQEEQKQRVDRAAVFILHDQSRSAPLFTPAELLVQLKSPSAISERRYKVKQVGEPNPKHISTNLAEPQN
ncbi:MAG TPA: DUF255 domain-containing protein [Candidatus Angelobacter sp.]|nr:DUF255 domain-containing protein [Candidatus Angelobacter sp.]